MNPLEILRAVAPAGGAWLVGGAVRDRLGGRATTDLDIAVAGDAAELARALAVAARAHAFRLSQAFGSWRVVDHRKAWQVDISPLAGRSIEEDLAKRDFTINALAEPLGGGEYVDPFGGLEDLHAGRLRMVSDRAFAEDPLRTLRLARLACELPASVQPETQAAARAHAMGLRDVAAERVFAELKRIVCAERVLDGLDLIDTLGLTPVILPELAGLRGVQQSHFHHLDVHDHTRAALAETIGLEREPEPLLGRHAPAVARLLSEPLGNGLTRGQALRFGALFHDVAKPLTRGVTGEGRVTFIGHDALGSQIASEALARLRAGDRLAEHVAALTRHHLRLGFLVHQAPLSRRELYRYLRECSPVQVDVTLLSVADRLATRGAGAEAAIARHLALARELLGDALAWRAHPPQPPLRGDDLADALGLRPGPQIGRVLAALEEESFAGEITTRGQALERARALVAGKLRVR